MKQARKTMASVVDVPLHTVRHLPSRRPQSQAQLASRDRWFLFAMIVIGLALRLDFLAASHFVVDADEAIVGLMAKHIAEGSPVPVFYYGQHYMGSLEPYLVSILFRFFGVSDVALRIVPLVFAIAMIPLLYRIGFECGSRRAGQIAAALAAVPPVGLVVWSAKARGGFIELVFIGAYALLLTIRWLKNAQPAALPVFAIGVVLGFGWWTNNQIIFFMIPIACCIVLRTIAIAKRFIGGIGRIISLGVTGTAGFLLGGLPFWLYNLRYDFISFQMFTSSGKRETVKHLQGLLDTALPILLGAKRFWESADIFPGSTLVAYSSYGAVVLIGLAIVLARIGRKNESPLTVLLLLLFVGATCGIFVVSSFGHLVQAPRYLLPAYVGLFVLAGLALEYLDRWSPVLAALCLCSIFALHIASAYKGGRAVPGEPIVYRYERVAHDHSELISWLEANRVAFVKTNYWIGYRLAFETKESVRFLVYREPRQTRIPSYKLDAERVAPEEIPYVLSPTQGAIVEQGLTVLGFSYERQSLSGYTVLSKVHRIEQNLTPVSRERFVLAASQHTDEASRAADGDLSSRWGTGLPQAPGMQLLARFTGVTTVRGIKTDLGAFEQDYPRKLIINARRPDDSIFTLMDEGEYFAARYALDDSSRMEMSFAPVEISELALNQMGQDSIFDWSVAELSVLQ